MADPPRAYATDSGRYYHWCHNCDFATTGQPCAEGLTVPSVTTILSNGVPKVWLPKWAAKKAAEYVPANLDWIVKTCATNPDAVIDAIKGSPWAVRDAAGDRGTRIHEYAETGQRDDTDKPWGERAQYQWVDDFMARYKPAFILREATTYSRTHSYAGTFDGIAYFPTLNKTLLLDYKSGKGLYPEHALQMAAYRYADFIGLPDGTEVPVPKVDGAVLVHIRPRSLKFRPVEAGPDQFRTFLYARQIAQFAETGDALIGAHIDPEGEAA